MIIFKIKINVVFLLNNFLFYMQNTFQYLHNTRCRFYVLISTKTNLYIYIWENRYDKILKTHDYFLNININAVLLLIKFLFYMQNTVQYLHHLPLQILNVYICCNKFYIH